MISALTKNVSGPNTASQTPCGKSEDRLRKNRRTSVPSRIFTQVNWFDTVNIICNIFAP